MEKESSCGGGCINAMAQLVSNVSYKRIKNISDWMLSEETQRGALAQIVNAISQLDITETWGKGRT